MNIIAIVEKLMLAAFIMLCIPIAHAQEFSRDLSWNEQYGEEAFDDRWYPYEYEFDDTDDLETRRRKLQERVCELEFTIRVRECYWDAKFMSNECGFNQEDCLSGCPVFPMGILCRRQCENDYNECVDDVKRFTVHCFCSAYYLLGICLDDSEPPLPIFECMQLSGY